MKGSIDSRRVLDNEHRLASRRDKPSLDGCAASLRSHRRIRSSKSRKSPLNKKRKDKKTKKLWLEIGLNERPSDALPRTRVECDWKVEPIQHAAGGTTQQPPVHLYRQYTR